VEPVRYCDVVGNTDASQERIAPGCLRRCRATRCLTPVRYICVVSDQVAAPSEPVFQTASRRLDPCRGTARSLNLPSGWAGSEGAPRQRPARVSYPCMTTRYGSGPSARSTCRCASPRSTNGARTPEPRSLIFSPTTWRSRWAKHETLAQPRRAPVGEQQEHRWDLRERQERSPPRNTNPSTSGAARTAETTSRSAG
jgi:hypothetical protein